MYWMPSMCYMWPQRLRININQTTSCDLPFQIHIIIHNVILFLERSSQDFLCATLSHQFSLLLWFSYQIMGEGGRDHMLMENASPPNPLIPCYALPLSCPTEPHWGENRCSTDWLGWEGWDTTVASCSQTPSSPGWLSPCLELGRWRKKKEPDSKLLPKGSLEK